MTAARATRNTRFNEPDQAVSFLRILLSVGATAIVMIDGAATRSGFDVGTAVVTVGLVLAALAVSWLLSNAHDMRSGVAAGSAWLLQVFDTVFFSGLAVAVAGMAADTAWVALVFPILFAGYRFPPPGIFGSWALVALSYWTLSDLARLQIVGGGLDIAYRAIALLAIAGALALLSGWLRDGWLDQAEMQVRLDRRDHHLTVIEDAVRAVRHPVPRGRSGQRTERQAVAHQQSRLRFVLDLGFAAATASSADRFLTAVGDKSMLDGLGPPVAPAEGRVDLTRWSSVDRPVDEVVYSASVRDPLSGATISGWQPIPVGDDVAQAFADLVARTSGRTRPAEKPDRRPTKSRDGDSPAAAAAAVPAPLAGLADRWELERAVDLVASHRGPIAVLMIDLDDFKSISYHRGRSLANEAMAGIARRLQEAVDIEGLAARYGEDQFVVVLTGRAATVAPGFAESLVAHMAEPLQLSSMELRASVTIGVAMADGPVTTNRLRHTAARASFEAKSRGRGTSHVLRCTGRGASSNPANKAEDTRANTGENPGDRTSQV